MLTAPKELHSLGHFVKEHGLSTILLLGILIWGMPKVERGLEAHIKHIERLDWFQAKMIENDTKYNETLDKLTIQVTRMADMLEKHEKSLVVLERRLEGI